MINASALTTVFRPRRMIRNLFVVFGALLAANLTGIALWGQSPEILLTLLAAILISAGNYGLNELLDIESDKHHPEKKFRALPAGKIPTRIVWTWSFIFYGLGFAVAFGLGSQTILILLGAIVLLIGFFYNAPPFRFKDWPYLDVITESTGYPLRIALGWYAVTAAPIPLILILGSWLFGAFLLTGKRFAELRYLAFQKDLLLYRKSFGFYSTQQLFLLMVLLAVGCSLVVFLTGAQNHFNFGYFLPVLAVFFFWYFYLAFQPNSIV
ncbi:MAG: UbiA family prenyltransferase, partial [Candidatus Doudnabacteria bacterium]|nr:UbiA family prenyltransferase [Candidatus Doudnabacteria bacterium]